MKKFMGLIMSFVLIVTMVPTIAFAEPEVVNIPDAQFKAKINYYLSTKDNVRDPNQDITKEEMNTLTSMNIGYKDKITDVEGIQYAQNLESFSVTNTVKNIGKIKDLQKLKGIALSEIEEGSNDVSFLGSKPELKELKISSKNITSLGGLTNANFPKLETLDLKQASNLKDISALANGPKGSLSKIDLGDTQVKDITPLKGYNNLKILNIEKIAISEANRAAYTETIKSLVSLEELYMSYCKIQDKDTEMFRPLSNLKVLVLNICELTNTDFCEFLPVGMTKIGLYGNDISNMNNLTRFKILILWEYQTTM